MTFCYENNIILCRLPSHTSHKLQPCDVAVFGPLKTAYREQVERLFRGGAGTIGKQHFMLLYSRARVTAIVAARATLPQSVCTAGRCEHACARSSHNPKDTDQRQIAAAGLSEHCGVLVFS
jgi:hypothetical protein